ncbi:MAG: LuxR C-terminal-related transcriptional regulator [Candidatus Levyibacteriota bacterium]
MLTETQHYKPKTIDCLGVAKEKGDPPLKQPILATLVYDSSTAFASSRPEPVISCPLFENKLCGAGKQTDPMMCIQLIPDLRIQEGLIEKRFEAKRTKLTSRQVEVLTLMAQGLSINESAEQLVIEPDSVKSHRQKIYDKYYVRSSEMAVVRGIREGAIPLDKVAAAYDFTLPFSLTELEKKILDTLVTSTESSSEAAIGQRIKRSEGTVHNSIKAIRRKFGNVPNRAAVAAYYEITKRADLVA